MCGDGASNMSVFIRTQFQGGFFLAIFEKYNQCWVIDLKSKIIIVFLKHHDMNYEINMLNENKKWTFRNFGEKNNGWNRFE